MILLINTYILPSWQNRSICEERNKVKWRRNLSILLLFFLGKVSKGVLSPVRIWEPFSILHPKASQQRLLHYVRNDLLSGMEIASPSARNDWPFFFGVCLLGVSKGLKDPLLRMSLRGGKDNLPMLCHCEEAWLMLTKQSPLTSRLPRSHKPLRSQWQNGCFFVFGES